MKLEKLRSADAARMKLEELRRAHKESEETEQRRRMQAWSNIAVIFSKLRTELEHAPTHPPSTLLQTQCAENINKHKMTLQHAMDTAGFALADYQVAEGKAAIDEEPKWQMP